MPRSSTVAIVSSRVPRLVAPDEPWLLGLRSVLRTVEADRNSLLIGKNTALAEFVRHAATRLSISSAAANSESEFAPDDAISQRDRDVIFSADNVYALTVRAQGHIDRLLNERLKQRRGPVVLVDLPGLQSESVQNRLRDAGADFWRPAESQCLPFTQTNIQNQGFQFTSSTCVAVEDVTVVHPFPAADPWEFLTHTTRSCPGPWPDSSFQTYVDSLLESRPDADHSTLGTLKKILIQKKLISSNQMIRGGHRVVSLTACPLEKLSSLYRFQTHRFRWDFQPFGLCIRRDWLQQVGTRAVIYGNDSHWRTLSEVDQPYFQISGEDSATNWTVEQEWRHLDDLDLSGLTNKDVMIFVPTFDAARSVAQVTTWPITIVPDRFTKGI